ncbi:MAG: 50S ribosomal protein L10 [Phycisphaerales bacterium]|nr:50S ribosomal protein L10 [Phycisphaerales bacterium]
MSKPVKSMILETYKKRFADLEGAVLIEVRGIKSNQNNKLRADMAAKQSKVAVLKNSLAAKALKGTKIEPLCNKFVGSVAMVYGGESVVSVARNLIETAKEMENLRFVGAVMDGVVFEPDQIEALSKYPTKAEAQGQVVTIILSPARKLVGQIVGPGRKIASLIKAIEEKKKDGEPAAA